MPTRKQSERIPFAPPDIGKEEIEAVVECMRSGWLTTGPRARQFEESFAQYLGAGIQAVAINSATSGLHLALEALGIGPGDKVLTSPYTFTATAEVVRYLGAEVVFADIEPDTCNIDPVEVESALCHSDDIKAIVPVHFAGQACDMTRIKELAATAGTRIVEDAAHALPCSFQGKKIGTLSDATVFSFYATKTLPVGEGGMLVSANAELIERAKIMRLHGINRDAFDRYSSNTPSWHYEVVAPGFKYNMTDIAAAIGIQQLAKLERNANRRREIAKIYDQGLAGLPLRPLSIRNPDDQHSWHLYVIQLDLEQLSIGRDEFIQRLSDKGISASVHFIPLHIQPYWRDRYHLSADDYPKALSAYNCAVSLPIHTRLSDQDVNYIIESTRSILGSNAS